MIVEGYAWRDHVEHDGAFVRDGRFEHRVQLLLVAGERTPHKRRSELDCYDAGVDRRKVVHDAGLEGRSQIGGGGKLSFWQAVTTVVLDHVNDRQVSKHEVGEMSRAGLDGVALARDSERGEGFVGKDRS